VLKDLQDGKRETWCACAQFLRFGAWSSPLRSGHRGLGRNVWWCLGGGALAGHQGASITFGNGPFHLGSRPSGEQGAARPLV